MPYPPLSEVTLHKGGLDLSLLLTEELTLSASHFILFKPILIDSHNYFPFHKD